MSVSKERLIGQNGHSDNECRKTPVSLHLANSERVQTNCLPVTPLLNDDKGTSPDFKLGTVLVTEVLKSTPSWQKSPEKIHVDTTGCVEHSVAQLPAKGAPSSSRFPEREKQPQQQALRYRAVASGDSLLEKRIKSKHRQKHHREEKTHEGEEQQEDRYQGAHHSCTLDQMLKHCFNEVISTNRTCKMENRSQQHNGMTPEYLSSPKTLFRGEKSLKEKVKQKNAQELPPLPERAIHGLTKPWNSPNGKPFHTVSLWEFPLLYVLLKQKAWRKFSSALSELNNLDAFSQCCNISRSILASIRDNPNQSISVPNLKKLSDELAFDLDWVEKMAIKAVKFNKSGKKEYFSFPFTLDIYAWRAICHITGDGNIGYSENSPYPYLRWTQWPMKGEVTYDKIPPKTQRFMRALLERLSRLPGGYSKTVGYPKALSYVILGTMPGMTFFDLRTPKFIQFVIDLPPEYRDWKIQFLAAFTIDDGSVSGKLSMNQSDKTTLESVMKLCDHLEYEHSPYPPREHERDGMHDFLIQSESFRDFYNTLNDTISQHNRDYVLGLWHKHTRLDNLVSNICDKRLEDNRRAKQVCEQIIILMYDNKVRSSKTIRLHSVISPLASGYSNKSFRDRLQKLSSLGLLIEVKKSDERSHRPKKWKIRPNCELKELLKILKTSYGNRAHKQSYKRKFVETEEVIEAIAYLKAQGITPTPTKVGQLLGCSRQVFYRRKDLRVLFED
jgi:hypothetical protein